jgi:HEAT repeats
MKNLDYPIPDDTPIWPFTGAAAASLLASLKATEAIDILIRSLHLDAQGFISINHHPICSAIIQIGKPAVPKLIEALSNERPKIRSESASALGSIGGDEAKKALEDALKTEGDESVRRVIAGTLTEMQAQKTARSR